MGKNLASYQGQNGQFLQQLSLKLKLKGVVVISLLAALFSIPAFAVPYPSNPDPQLTPGALCNTPSERRYQERIAYCERDVTEETKNRIIQVYDSTRGYHIGQMQRNDFKIDHLIPLSIGGSNDVQNLWPQHKSVYEITDPIESEVSLLMNQGSITQKEAIDAVLYAKRNLDEAPGVLAKLRARRNARAY